jgi:hypothetical protein
LVPPLRCCSPSPRWCLHQVRALDFWRFLFPLFGISSLFRAVRRSWPVWAIDVWGRETRHVGLIPGIQGWSLR